MDLNSGELTAEPQRPIDHVFDTRRALVRNISFDIIAQWGYLLSRVFIPPFILARIGLSRYGLWSSVFLIVSYVGISSIGFTSAYVKFVAEYVGRGETRKANSILSTGILVCGLVCGSLFGALLLSMPQILRWLSVPESLRSDARYVILLVVGMHSCDIVLSVYRAALAGCQKILEAQCIWVIDYLLEAGLIFWLVGTGHGIRGLADAFAVSTGVSITLGIIVARRQIPWLKISPRQVSRDSCHTLLSFGGVLQFGAFLSQAMETVERLIAAPLIGLAAVSVLDIGAKLPRMSGSIPGALVNSFLPASSYLNAGLADSARGKQVLGKLYLRGSRYLVILAAVMLGFMATAAAPILGVWIGRVYPSTLCLMTIFSVQQYFDCLTGTGSILFRGIGRPWQEFAYTLPNIALAVVFIPLSRLIEGRWSAIGLGSAIAAAQSIAAVWFAARANHFFAVSFRDYFRAVIIPSLVPFAVGAVVALPLCRMVAATSRWQGALFIGMGGVVYLLTLLVLVDRFVLATDERGWFREIIRERWTRCKSLPRRLYGSLAVRSA